MSRHAGPGRPSKGDRKLLTTRPPRALADVICGEADRLGLTWSDYIANVLAQAHGFPPIATPKDEEQMRLTA